MEKVPTCNREIHLISGHMGSGKSYYFEFLKSLPEYQGPQVFIASKDTIYVRYFGWRTGKPVEDNQDGYLAIYNTMTPRERSYTDELLRVDTERAIVVNRVKRVLLDVGMRTRKVHQEPFVATVRKAERLLRVTEAEHAVRQGLLAPDPAPRVNLRALFLFCDFATICQRMAARWPGSTGSDKLPAPLIESMLGYEVPIAYEFLALDTSDESLGAESRRKQEVLSFLANQIPNYALMAARAREAKRCIAATKREMRKILNKKQTTPG